MHIALKTYCKPKSYKNQGTKIWPQVGLASIRVKAGGAWRVWRLCHLMDTEGSGRVTRSELWEFIDHLGIGGRKRRRWIGQAVKLGLIREHKEYYYFVNLARAAVILGCEKVGRPATVETAALVRAGWRSFVWSAYLVTLNNRPVSQSRKAELTGVLERTQRYYQAGVPGTARLNFANRGSARAGRAEGLREVCGLCTFENKRGKVVQRLPDIRIVPFDISKTANRGRSRKAQKQVNHFSFNMERDPDKVLRLFCEGAAGVKGALKAIAQLDITDRPGEIFEHVRAGPRANAWRVVSV